MVHSSSKRDKDLIKNQTASTQSTLNILHTIFPVATASALLATFSMFVKQRDDNRRKETRH